MSKRSSKTKSKRRSRTLPALGFAGVSLSMASGACAPTGEAMANAPPTSQGQSQEIFLGEEEISDVSLATFYVVNKEAAGFQPRRQFAMGGGGGCGCGCGCAATTGNYGAWTPESNANLPHRSIKPAHPPRRTHVPRN